MEIHPYFHTWYLIAFDHVYIFTHKHYNFTVVLQKHYMFYTVWYFDWLTFVKPKLIRNSIEKTSLLRKQEK